MATIWKVAFLRAGGNWTDDRKVAGAVTLLDGQRQSAKSVPYMQAFREQGIFVQPLLAERAPVRGHFSQRTPNTSCRRRRGVVQRCSHSLASAKSTKSPHNLCARQICARRSNKGLGDRFPR